MPRLNATERPKDDIEAIPLKKTLEGMREAECTHAGHPMISGVRSLTNARGSHTLERPGMLPYQRDTTRRVGLMVITVVSRMAAGPAPAGPVTDDVQHTPNVGPLRRAVSSGHLRHGRTNDTPPDRAVSDGMILRN